MEPASGLRARKKAATRQSLHETALRLALARGLDGVTVEDIADEVGVSRRTFSNYFANKEDAVLHADRERMRRMVELVRDRPADEPAWTALRRSAAELYGALPAVEPALVAQMRLLRRHPSLLARQSADQIALERDLADLLVERGHADDELARLMAALFLTTIRTAGALWLEQAGRQSLPELVDQLSDRVRFE